MKKTRKILHPDSLQSARLAVAGGLTVREAAEKCGLDYEATRKRAQREGWLNTARAQREAEKRITAQALEVVAESLAERGKRYEGSMANAAEKFASLVEKLPPDQLLKSARSIESLDKVSRRTFRLDAETEKANANAVSWAVLGYLDAVDLEVEARQLNGRPRLP
jgi:hypothetical protein